MSFSFSYSSTIMQEVHQKCATKCDRECTEIHDNIVSCLRAAGLCPTTFRALYLLFKSTSKMPLINIVPFHFSLYDFISMCLKKYSPLKIPHGVGICYYLNFMPNHKLCDVPYKMAVLSHCFNYHLVEYVCIELKYKYEGN